MIHQLDIERVYKGHKRDVKCLLVFRDSKMTKIVSLSDDNESQIRVWNAESGECIKQLKVCHAQFGVGHMVKLDEERFFCCTDVKDGTFHCFRISDLEEEGNAFCLENFKGNIRRMASLGEDTENKKNGVLIGCTTYAKHRKIKILSFRKQKEIREIMNVKTGDYSELVLSKKFPNCFYFNESVKEDNKVEVLRINFKTGKAFVRFNTHEGKIHTINTYVNAGGKEILICGGDPRVTRIYFYDTENGNLVKSIETKNRFCSLCPMDKGKFVMVGDHKGCFELIHVILNINSTTLRSVEIWKEIHDDAIYDLKLFDESSNFDDSTFRMISCSRVFKSNIDIPHNSDVKRICPLILSWNFVVKL